MRCAVPITAILLALGCTDPETTPIDPVPPDLGSGVPMDQGLMPAMDDGGASDLDMAQSADSGQPDGSTGEIRVGYRESTLTYTPRGAQEERTLSVSLWYPTQDERGEFTAYQSIFVRDDVMGDAQPALAENAPLLIFSHGRCGFSQYSFFLTEHFARAGWLVAAADHTGDVLGIDCTERGTAAIYEHRPQDISAVIDFFGTLPEEDPLSGAASDKIGVVGHSFGGYTGLVVAGAQFAVDQLQETCNPEGDSAICDDINAAAPRLREGFYDSRIKALVAIAPGDYRVLREGIAAIEIPTLLMTASSDLNNPDEVDGDPIWSQLDGQADRRVRFDQAGHFSFTSICLITGPRGVNNGCSEETIPPEDLHPVINAYVEAFLNAHVLGDEGGRPLIDGETTLRDEVTVVLPESGR